MLFRSDGHTESVAIRLKQKARPEEIVAAWNDFRAEPQQLRLPSAPEQPVVYMTAADRPQPRFDVDLGGGMTTAVGRLRKCNVLDWKFTVLSHNTIRGAAGAALLALIVATALSVYKPRGLTGYGWRKLHAQPAAPQS